MSQQNLKLRATLRDEGRSWERMGTTLLNSTVWEFGTSVGMRDLAALHGYLFSHAGKTWRSNQHTALTLSAAGVQDGDLVEFAGDFEPLAGDEPAVQPRAADSVSDGEAGGSRASTANGRDASAKDSPKEGARPGSRGVGTPQGTKKDAGATDSPKEGTRPVRTPEGSRGVRTPESTKKDASVKDSAKEGARAVTTPEGSRGVRTPDGTKKDTIATSESTPAADGAVPSAPAAPAPAAKAQIRVTLIDHKKRQRECVGRASLETCVWDFGVSVGMDHLATLHGYLFTYAGQTWLSNGPNKHQSLTLAAAGVQDGETVTFAGDFESVVYLNVTLADNVVSRQRFGKASALTSVWLFGELLGLRTLEAQLVPGCGYTFRKDGGPTWRSKQYPNLTLAATAVKSGDWVEFAVEVPPEPKEE